MSLLSKYLRSLRTRRHLSELKIAKRAQLDLDSYRCIEANPELISLPVLNRIFDVLRITGDEFIEFSYIATRVYSPTDESPGSEMEKEISETAKIIEFKDKRGLNGVKRKRRVKKLTRDTDLE